MVAGMQNRRGVEWGGRTRRIGGALLLAGCLMPGIAAAHPGHGVEEGSGILHEIWTLTATAPIGVCLVAGALFAAAVLLRRALPGLVREP